jgi:hypothetical protein
MGLTINRFHTRCQVPRPLNVDRRLLERVGWEQVAPECARWLATQRTRLPAIIRIRRLHVSLTLSAAQLQENRAASPWADAFSRSLLAALANATGETVRAESHTEWVARAIVALLEGEAAQRWEYKEFHELFRLGPAAACLALFETRPEEILSLLVALEKEGKLARTLNLLDPLAIERLFLFAEKAYPARGDTPLSIENLLELGRVLLRSPLFPGHRILERKISLRLLAILTLEGAAGNWTPARVTHALAALGALLQINATAQWKETLADFQLEKLPSSPARELLEKIRSPVSGKITSSNLIALDHLLSTLRPLALSDERVALQGEKARWISSDCAGVFLLAGVLEKMRWPERFLRSSLDTRASDCFLTGIALAALDRMAQPIERIEPAVALFAGWPNEPDHAAFAHFCAAGSPAERLQLLREFCGADFKSNPTDTETWAGTFDALAARLLSEFAKRVRGFRQASRKFVSVNFLKVPGRICLEEKRLLVALAPNPFHVALHLSAADEPMESIPWLGCRRLEFQLEGL